MAITEVTTVVVDGITIGLSDEIGTLVQNGDFTPENLAPYMFCGQLNYVTPKFSSLTSAEKTYSGSSGSAPLYFPNVNTGSLGGVTVEFAINDNPSFTSDLYGRNVLLYDTGRVESIHSDSTGMTARVVTSIDFKKIYYDVDAANRPITTGRPAETIGCYVSGASGTVKTIDNDVDTLIKVYSIVETDSTWYCMLDNMFPASDTDGYSHICSSWQYMQGNYDNTYESLNYCLDSFDKTKSMFKYAVSNNYEIYGGAGGNWNNSFTSYVDITEDVYSYMDYYALNYSANFHCYIKTLNGALEQLARAGLKFKWNNNWYKPIGEGGYITGYTNDMSETSDWDDIEDVTGNVVPVTPPGPTPPPPPEGDDIDSMGFDGMSCNVGGPAKYYIMSYSDIHHLIGDFNVHAEPGTSISNNIISCYVNALDWNWSTGSEVIEIYSGGAQTAAFTSDKNYSVLTGYNARDIIGSIDVPRMTNTFYDFSPYSTYEVYVPFCGWVALPDTVAGRHIKIYFETDEATCGCKGRVFFVDDAGNGVTVAEITGSFGAPCPIQVIEGGLYKQAMLSNGLQVIGGIASGIMGGAAGSGVLAVGGLNAAMQSLGNCLIAGNTNYGQTIGRAGDASGLMCAGKPYLKITYPPIDEVVNNSIFGHTVGYLCNTIGQLNSFHGFTVCANPHIHISATSAEKEEIKRLLEEGVILP